jgi:uncharacterized phage protein gp47/JayE
MATLTYADLIRPMTREQVFTLAIPIFQAAGSPVDSWGAFDEPRATLEFIADAIADASEVQAQYARMGVLGTSAEDGATGDALTLKALDDFDEARKPAVQTRGTVTLTDTSGGGHSFADGALIFSSSADEDLVYRNVGAVVVPPSGSVAVTIGAESPGAAYNVSGNTIALATPVPGLALSVATALGWVTQTGVNEEDDESLRLRCRSKWSTLTTTGPSEAYIKWALDSSDEITRARVQEDPFADVTAGFPAVTVIVASSSGPASPSALAAAVANVQLRRPLGSFVSVINATANPIDVRGQVKVKAAFRTAARAKALADLQAFFEALGLGEAVLVSQVVELLMAVPGVVDVTLTNGLGAPLATGAVMGAGLPPADAVNVLVYLLDDASWVSV